MDMGLGRAVYFLVKLQFIPVCLNIFRSMCRCPGLCPKWLPKILRLYSALHKSNPFNCHSSSIFYCSSIAFFHRLRSVSSRFWPREDCRAMENEHPTLSENNGPDSKYSGFNQLFNFFSLSFNFKTSDLLRYSRNRM